MMRFNHFAGIQVVALSALVFGLSACSDREERNQEVGRNFTRESRNLGAVTERRGEAEVKGHQEITERRIEKVNESIPTIITGERKADLNRMGVNDFRALGATKTAAKNIVDYRSRLANESFTSVDQLRQVPGVDVNWLEQNRDIFGISTQAE